MRKIILTILVILVVVCPAKGDLVFDSGYNTFDANDPYYDEVVVINDAHLDVLGGTMWKLELNDYATANIYSGDMDLLFTNENSVANIHNGTIGCFGAYDNSVVNLYAYDVAFHPVDEYGESWIEGRYYSNNNSFTLGVWHRDHYSHVNIVPEPVVDAEIDIDPDTVNLKSKGKWITCRIWLPADYSVADIEPNSVLIENEPNDIYPEWIWFNENKQVVMAKFNRVDVCEILEAGNIELTVTGHLVDGTYFQGTDTIRVIDKERKNK